MLRRKTDNGFTMPINFNEVMPELGNRPYILFIDRDGTLVPISEVPADAILPDATASLVRDLANPKHGHACIVSARGLKGLAQEFDGDHLILAGNYGLEVSFPGGRQIIHPDAAKVLPELAEVAAIFRQELAENPLLLLDDHNYSLCLHYHRVPRDQHDAFHKNMETLASKFAALKFRNMPTSVEVVPPVVWDKGAALDLIAAEIKWEEGKEPYYLAFGDSHPDDAMFRWINKHGGLSINIGHREGTEATYELDSPADLYNFLTQLKETTVSKAAQSVSA
jgi:trehalose 6-phosphate phosphatase